MYQYFQNIPHCLVLFWATYSRRKVCRPDNGDDLFGAPWRRMNTSYHIRAEPSLLTLGLPTISVVTSSDHLLFGDDNSS